MNSTINPSGVFNEYLETQRSRVPCLSPVSEVSNCVVRILGGNPGEFQLQGTNTYLVGTGNSRILIDTGQGFPIWAATIKKYLADFNIKISKVLLTHWHCDHTGGIEDIIAHDPTLAEHIYKNQPDHGQRPITDGQIFKVEGATLQAVYTPGHSIDHICFVLLEENALFTGDNVLGHGYTSVEDLSMYSQSLNRMAGQECISGYPGHGMKIEDLPKVMRLYISHRELREKQVYAKLFKNKAGRTERSDSVRKSLTVKALAFSIHGEVGEDLFASVLKPCLTQILCKLAETQQVGFEIVGGERQWFACQ